MSTLNSILSVVATTTAVGQLALAYSKARSSGKSSRMIRVFERKAVEYGIPLVGIAACTAGLWGFMRSEEPLTRPEALAIALLCSCIGLQLALFTIGRTHRLLASSPRRSLIPVEDLVRRSMVSSPGEGKRAA